MNTRRNVIANVGGRIWQALMSFAFVPFYIRLMGVEAYALIGVFATILALFAVLDVGTSTTVNRELGRLGDTTDRADARILLRTLEIIFWVTGFAIAATVALGSDYIAGEWLNLRTLDAAEAQRAIRCMAVVVALRWPGILYTGALMGLRNHVRLNVINSVAATLQGLGAMLTLALISPTITAFFLWQIAVAAVQAALLHLETWRCLRQPGHRAGFRWSILRPVLGFSAGVTGITALSTILMQLDRVMLSWMVPLEVFGYYTLACAIAGVLSAAALAVFGAVLPSLSLLVAENRTRELAAAYHKGSQLLAVLLIPVAAMIFFFAGEMLTIYVRDPAVVDGTRTLLAVLSVAFMLNSVMLMPLALQYAHGWTRLVLFTNIVVAVLFVPVLWALVGLFGALGAAYTWLIVSTNYILVMVNMMHRRLLPEHKWRWYLEDFGQPMLISFGIMGAVRLLLPADLPAAAAVVAIGTAFVLVLAITVAALPEVRAQVMTLLPKRREAPHG